MRDFIGAIDQGHHQHAVHDIRPRRSQSSPARRRKHQQIYPQPGWVDTTPTRSGGATEEVVAAAMQQRSLGPRDLAAIGIHQSARNHVLWNRTTGRPLYNALVGRIPGGRLTSPIWHAPEARPFRVQTGSLCGPTSAA